MISTAGRIGAAVGSVQRSTLQLVSNPSRALEFPVAAQAARAAEESASRMMREIEEQAATVRRQAARQLEDISTQAEEKYRELTSSARTTFTRYFSRALRLADTHPLKTIAASAAAGFTLGVALRFRRPPRG
jgi:ElaB/YqjD/DUF883 family membrane-anchored ribosome-binding protein